MPGAQGRHRRRLPRLRADGPRYRGIGWVGVEMGVDPDCRRCGMCGQGRPPAEAPRRLLLSLGAAHLTDPVRAVGRRIGAEVEVLTPSLVQLSGGDLTVAVRELRAVTSTVEAAEVRVLLDDGDTQPTQLLAAAMAAPTLDQLGARLQAGDLQAMFTDEAASFRSVYQPIIDLTDRRVVAYEALLRARDANGVDHLPGPLFAQAQRAGWGARLDRIGRTSALTGAAGWLGGRSLFVNFVPTSIYDPRVCLATTERAATRAGIELANVVFEVTESERVTDPAHLESVFAYYRQRGARVALDDLGSGWSSLNLLARLQPEVVKLDRELIEGLSGPAARAVVSAVVEISHSYGGQVLAEGVESEHQSAAVLGLGVDLAQGWLYGRPMPPPVTDRTSRRRTMVGVRRS